MIDEMCIVIMHQELPRCQISCTLQRGLLTLWLTCTLVQLIMIPRKRITLSSSVTTIGFAHTVYSWLQSYLIGRYQSVHVDRQSSTPTLSTFGVPGDQSWSLCSFYIYLLSDIVRSFNVQHRQYADDTNTMPIFISFFHRLFNWHIKSHSLIHSLSLHSWFCLIAWF